MNQQAYTDRAHEWRPDPHITKPTQQRSWEDAVEAGDAPPRKYAPPPEPPAREDTGRYYEYNERHETYTNIYYTTDGNWRGLYQVKGQRYWTPTKPTAFQAAMAYNDVIRLRKLPKRYLIEMENMVPVVRDEDGEAVA